MLLALLLFVNMAKWLFSSGACGGTSNGAKIRETPPRFRHGESLWDRGRYRRRRPRRGVERSCTSSLCAGQGRQSDRNHGNLGDTLIEEQQVVGSRDDMKHIIVGGIGSRTGNGIDPSVKRIRRSRAVGAIEFASAGDPDGLMLAIGIHGSPFARHPLMPVDGERIDG